MYDSSERSDLRDGEETPPPKHSHLEQYWQSHTGIFLTGWGGVGDMGLEVYTGDLHIWD